MLVIRNGSASDDVADNNSQAAKGDTSDGLVDSENDNGKIAATVPATKKKPVSPTQKNGLSGRLVQLMIGIPV